ncbi:MAG: hypothetical protein ACQESH_06840 [Campylobacterota bacterium]
MSKQSSVAKIDFMLEMIENIEKIVKRHGGIVKAIDDFEGQMALLMGIAQIGETLKKFDDTVLTKHDLMKDKEGHTIQEII